MKLHEWLKQNGLRKDFFAKKLGVTRGTLHTWISGKIKPHPSAQKLIEILTNGEVKPSDFDVVPHDPKE